VSSVHLSLDFHSGVPIYLQIVEQIQELVLNGELIPGDQLPTVRQLAAEIRVNFNTVARAYRMLDEARLISTQQGRGTYILNLPGTEFKQKIKTASLDVQLKRALQALVKQGYSQEEILAELELILDQKNIQETDEEE
jgi:GntR family transcriptional regulator